MSARIDETAAPRVAVQDAIVAHCNAWQAYQNAPELEEDADAAWAACDAESEALSELLGVVPESIADYRAIIAHLDWYVVEEAQMKNRGAIERAPFAVVAMVRMAQMDVSGRGQ